MASYDIADPAFLRSVLGASDDCIKVISLDGALTFMSEGGMRVMEVSDFNAIRGCPWPDFWKMEGNDTARAAVAAAREGRSSRFVGMADTAKGNPRWWDVQVSPIPGPDGRPAAILSVSRDITELKRSEERSRLLGQEMSHRMKNALSIVQAVVGQTLRTETSLESARSAVGARLAALGRAQDLLAPSAWTKAALGDVVDAMTSLHGGVDHFEVSGPPVGLSSAQAMAMALVLNELATNAAKYGALSRADGRVEINWTAGADGPFAFTWRESGGPAVATPMQSGFGSELITRVIAAYFDGDVSLDYAPQGLVFLLSGRI